MKYKQKFSIDFQYEVLFTHNLFSAENKTLTQLLGTNNSKVIVFIDEGVHKAFPSLRKDIIKWSEENPGVIDLKLPLQIVEGGEKIKNNLQVVERLCDTMIKAGICRHSYCLIIGGGAVTDAVGFAASIFHRGVNQIRIPTTVLSQDDSAVGVKNAVNYKGIKNLFGTFYPPYAVINDSLFLTSLDQRDILAGIAEAFKVAIIKDEDFYYYMKHNAQGIKDRDMMVLETIIKKSALHHMDHICNSGDPFEKGSSRPLDFGHWAAHRIESLTENEVKHGEAVAMGICIDMYAAAQMEMVSNETAEDVVNTLLSCGYTLWHDILEECDKTGSLKIMQGLKEFQEHLGGELTLAIPTCIGKVSNVHIMPEDFVNDAVARLKAVAKT